MSALFKILGHDDRTAPLDGRIGRLDETIGDVEDVLPGAHVVDHENGTYSVYESEEAAGAVDPAGDDEYIVCSIVQVEWAVAS